MRHLILLFVVTCLGACTNKPQADTTRPLQPGEPQAVLTHLDLLHPEESLAPTFAIHFGPSFHYASSFVVLKDSAILMTFAQRDYERWTLKTVHSRIFRITLSEWQSLARGIALFNERFTKTQEPQGCCDGISVGIASDKLIYTGVLYVRSPYRDEESEYYKILDPLFIILHQHLILPNEVDYLRHLKRYFDHDYKLPAELVSTMPYKYRIYDKLMEHYDAQVGDLIDGMPTSVPITIDMSSLAGMDTILYSHFQRLLKRNSRVQWLATPNAYRHLINLGVPEENIKQAMSVEFPREH